MKRSIISIFVLIFVLSGCGSKTDIDFSQDSGDDVLTIWAFYEGVPKVAADYYSEKSGVKVDFQTIGREDYEVKLNTVIGTEDAPDLIMLEKSFMGSYLGNEAIVSLDDMLADDELYETYKNNTDLATQGPGVINDQVKAIGWENTSSAFFYRSDLAEQCLGIKSIDEMEAATQTIEDYTTIQYSLRNSSDESCNQMSLFSYPDMRKGLLQAVDAFKVENGTYTITSSFDEVLDVFKTMVDEGMIYSPTSDKIQIVSGNEQDAFLGNISPAWGTYVAEEYQQPGQWAIAKSPLTYADGGTYLAVSNNADYDIVQDFFDETFFNEAWLVDNMQSFGLIGNTAVMNKYQETHPGENEYYSGENTVDKFAEISQSIDEFVPVTQYDAGINDSIDVIIEEYAVNGTLKTTEEAKEALKTKIEGLYPDLNVVIE